MSEAKASPELMAQMEKARKLALVRQAMTAAFKAKVQHLQPLQRQYLVQGYMQGLADAFNAMQVAVQLANEDQNAQVEVIDEKAEAVPSEMGEADAGISKES